MKKLIYVIALVLGTGLAANAQSNQRSEEATDKAVNVEVVVAGQEAQDQQVETSGKKSCDPSEAKACCSSKKGKKGKTTASASKSGKACCAEGETSANCDHKRHKADGTMKDSD